MDREKAEDEVPIEAPAVPPMSDRPVAPEAAKGGPDAPDFWWSGYGPFSFWP